MARKKRLAQKLPELPNKSAGNASYWAKPFDTAKFDEYPEIIIACNVTHWKAWKLPLPPAAPAQPANQEER